MGQDYLLYRARENKRPTVGKPGKTIVHHDRTGGNRCLPHNFLGFQCFSDFFFFRVAEAEA